MNHSSMNHSTMNHSNHYLVMFIIMIISGLLSTMNIYADKLSDIRWSVNDVYMILLMTGWMIALMAIYYKNLHMFILGCVLVVFNIWAIRSQFMISESQYILGMIPHHSMAIHMSKKLIEKKENSIMNRNSINTITDFLKNIIYTQTQEIEFMKSKIYTFRKLKCRYLIL